MVNLKQYTGSPCKNCGNTQKYMCSSTCTECSKNATKLWYKSKNGQKLTRKKALRRLATIHGYAVQLHNCSLRRTRKKHLTPQLTIQEKEGIVDLYQKAKLLTEKEGIRYDVDHIF